jgi:probable HAF family extracellular repeat protein
MKIKLAVDLTTLPSCRFIQKRLLLQFLPLMNKIFSVIVCVTLAALLGSPASGQTDNGTSTPLHAFVWDAANGMRDLGTLGGNISYGLGINNHGVVVGFSYLADNVTAHTFLWSPDRGMVDVGATLAGASSNWGVGINASGTLAVTGFLADGSSLPGAFALQHYWRHLPGSPVSSLNRSYGINDANQVTGTIASPYHTAFLWDLTTSSVSYVLPLPGGSDTYGVAINNIGHIAGAGSVADGSYHALIWSADQGSRDIGKLNGSAFSAGGGINNRNEVVGYNLPELGGFYWSDATGMLVLQSLGGSVSAAFGINNAGMITGYGGLPGGTVHAVLWNNHASAPQDLGTLSGSGNSYGKSINSSGQIVGYSEVP